MKIVGMMLARNSAWVIGASARSALSWCDDLVIFAHACSDGTVDIARALAAEHPGRVEVIEEPDPVWNEMDHRERVLVACRARGGTCFANVDDDEIVTSNIISDMRSMISTLGVGGCMCLPWLSVWRGLDMYRSDLSQWSNRQVDVVFADAPRMCYRPGGDGYQHHGRRPRGNDGSTHTALKSQSMGGLLHLQFASERRLLAKQALYKMWEITRWPNKRSVEQINKMYDGTALAPNIGLAPVPPAWWAKVDRSLIDVSAEPWQEVEVKRLYTVHGKATFAGLNLYGVV